MSVPFDWRSSIVAIIGRRHTKEDAADYLRPAGIGFVVSPNGLIATCVHVIRDLTDWIEGDWDASVKIRFKVNDHEARALVLKHYYDPGLDLAILSLVGDLPEGVQPLSLSSTAGATGHTVHMSGYPAGYGDGLDAEGTVVGTGRQLQITSFQATHGFSGSPVWDDKWQRVIGMVTSGTKVDSAGRLQYENFALPAETLVETCPLVTLSRPPAPNMAPEPPPTYVPRIELYNELRSAVFEAAVGEEPPGSITLLGPGGFGKTTLAEALCHDSAIIEAFPDGILWAILGQSPTSVAELSKVYKALTGETGRFIDETDASPAVLQALQGKKCLLVLDDVWRARDVWPFVSNVDQCLRLITTRDFTVAVDVKRFGPAHKSEVETMTSTEATLLLASQIDTLPSDLARFTELAVQLGGWPLRLELAAAALSVRRARGDTVDGALDYIQRANTRRGAVAFDLQKPHDRNEAISLSMEASLGMLEARERRRYLELAVVPADVPVPLSILEQLWDLDDLDTEDLVQRFSDLSLTMLDLKERSVRLHDEIRTYLVSTLDNPTAVHGRLVDRLGSPLSLKNEYTWRWLGHHLAGAKHWEQLYDLARDEDFAHRQQEALPAEPDLPLRTVRLALEVAVKQERAGLMAEFLSLHAQRVRTLRRKSPLEALRTLSGRAGLDRAWQLADAHDIELRVLWYLLLVWVLVTDSRQLEAKATLARLNRQSPAILSSPYNSLAAWLLVQLARSNPSAALDLASEIVPDDQLLVMVELLLQDRAFDLALRTIDGIEDQTYKAAALKGVAAAQLRAGIDEDAEVTFGLALEAAGGIEDPLWKAWMLGMIATARAEAGDFEWALSVVAAIDDKWLKAHALKEIGATQARTGLDEIASDTLALALEAAGGIDSGVKEVEAMSEIAVVQYRTGSHEAATRTFSQALETAASMSRRRDRAQALGRIAVAKARTADAEGSLALVDGMNKSARSEILAEIAAIQAKEGDIEGALSTAGRVELRQSKVQALKQIAVAQAAAGDFKAALETAHEIACVSRDAEDLKAKVVSEIGIIQAAAADLEDALATAKGVSAGWEKAKVLLAVAAAQAKSGQNEAAAGTLASALDNIVDIEGFELERATALGDIAAAQTKADSDEAAAGTLALALETVAGVDDPVGKEEAFSEIVYALAITGDTRAAMEAVKAINDSRERADALSQIMFIRIEAEDFEGALTAAGSIERRASKVEALGQIAAAQAAAGAYEAALETVAGIDRETEQAVTMAQKAAALARAGDVDGALKEAARIDDLRSKAQKITSASMLRSIATSQARNRDFDGAIALATGIEDKEEKALALTQIAVALVAAGLHANVQDSFALALETAAGIDDGIAKADTLRKIANAQVLAGMSNAAKDTFALALETIAGIDDSILAPLELLRIVDDQASSGDYQGALETVSCVGDSVFRGELLKLIAVAQARAGHGALAVRTASQILTKLESHLPEIALALAQAKEKEAFARLLLLCHNIPEVALPVCGAIAHLYPEQAADVAAVVIEYR